MLILDHQAQDKIHALLRRAADREPMPRAAIERQIARRKRGRNVAVDIASMLLLREGFFVAFWLEDSPHFGLCRHLAVGHRELDPAAVAALRREFGMPGRLGEYPAWYEPLGGRGLHCMHTIEPVSPLSTDLQLTPQLMALVDYRALDRAPDEELDDDG